MTPQSIVKSAISRCMPLGLISRSCAPVLTYHACFEEVPPSVAAIDNVRPQRLHDHLQILKRRFRFVSVDELSEAKRLRGLAAVTFDDGYKSVIQNALPVMNALGIPFTIFVNTNALEGKVLWRHKLIYAIKNQYPVGLPGSAAPPEDLYRESKTARYHSRIIEDQLDAVLHEKNVTLPNYLFDEPSCFVKHPLVWYGNHSHNHYVLSSLSLKEQREELSRTKQVLDGISGINVSRVFALPFGETHHANSDTCTALRELGYRALLMNRGGVNFGPLRQTEGIHVVERLSPNEQKINWILTRELALTCRMPALRYAAC